MVKDRLSLTIRVPVDFAGFRVDQAASALVPDLSRSRLRHSILNGELRINNQKVKPASRLSGSEHLELDMPIEQQTFDQPEELALDIVHQDEHLIVIDKPAALVVHPAAGNRSGTLLNALLYHFAELADLPRAGIVHRLDKDTSGLLVVARTELARQSLIEQLQDRSMSRVYFALCHGITPRQGEIEQPIGRNRIHRKKMAIVNSGKPAKTCYRRTAQFDSFSQLRLHLTTGRTHQIRVHMQSVGHPVVGDQLYGGKRKTRYDFINAFDRQALHAIKLSCVHPASGEQITFTSELPDDITTLLDQLTAVTKDDH